LIKGKVNLTDNTVHYFPKEIDKAAFIIPEPECMRTPLDVLPRRSESRLAVLEVFPEENDMFAKIKGLQVPTLTISALDVNGKEIAKTSIDWDTVLGAPNPFTKT